MESPDVFISANLNDDIAAVTTFEHAPEVSREDVDVLALVQENLVVVQFVPVVTLNRALIVDLLRDGEVLNGPWQGTSILHEVPPFGDPGGTHDEIGEAAIFDD